MQIYISSLARFIQTAFLLVSFLMAPNSFAEIFKCVDEATGKIAFTDHACPDDKHGEYQPTGSTNVDTNSASLNEAGTSALRNGTEPTGYQKSVSQAKEVGMQHKTETAKTTKTSAKDPLWFERRMCQKKKDCDSCCYDQFPLPN